MTAPLLVYDDDCGFCTWCALAADRYGVFDLVGFADVDDDLRARLPADWERCVHLVVGEEVYSCGKATEQALARLHRGLWVALALASRVPGYPTLRERLYRWGADRRDWLGRVVSASSA